MTDALKNLSNDSTADKRVKKKLLMVLGSWREQYKDDPSMSVVAGLYKQCRGTGPRHNQEELANLMGLSLPTEENKRTDKQEAKKKAKLEKERAKKEVEDRLKKKRVPFDFEKVDSVIFVTHLEKKADYHSQDKSKVLSSIVEASQASSNLVNAITVSYQQPTCLQNPNSQPLIARKPRNR
jgi:hypothetical protein